MMRDIYNGRKLAVKSSARQQRTTAYVNGVLVWSVLGSGAKIETIELESLRRWVDAADVRRTTEPDAYGKHWYVSA